MPKTPISQNALQKRNQKGKKKNKHQSYLYQHVILLILMIIEWSVQYNENELATKIFKPSVMILMNIFLYNRTEDNRSGYVWGIIAGFFFSLLGDIFLMFEGKELFLLGLVSFALAHISYIISFISQSIRTKVDQSRGLWTYIISGFVYGAGFGVFKFLEDKVEKDLIIPVAVYAFLLTSMVVATLMRHRRTSQLSFWTTFIGSVLFMASDVMLSLEKFANFKSLEIRLAVMMTYYLAQEFIFIGTLDNEDINRKKAID